MLPSTIMAVFAKLTQAQGFISLLVLFLVSAMVSGFLKTNTLIFLEYYGAFNSSPHKYIRLLALPSLSQGPKAHYLAALETSNCKAKY